MIPTGEPDLSFVDAGPEFTGTARDEPGHESEKVLDPTPQSRILGPFLDHQLHFAVNCR